MKKVILLLIAVATAGVFTANAQGGGGGGFQRRTPEENLKMVKEKLADLKLNADQTTKSDTVFINFYRDRDKMMQDMRAGGGQPDRDAMRAKNEKMAADRDEKLKGIFSADQFKKWKDEIEPAMRPQRRQGGGGGNN